MRIRGAVLASTVICLLVVSGGCDEPEPPGQGTTTQGAASKVEQKLRGAPLGQDRLPTTHHRIYVANLESRLEAVEELVESAGDEAPPALRTELAGLYRSRLAYRADLADLTRATKQVERALESAPRAPQALVLAAELSLLGHRFDRAEEFADRAEKAGAHADAVAGIRRELDWSRGNTETAVASVRSDAKSDPTVHSLVRLAVLERELGNRRASELAYERAESMIVDTNPYTVAWLNFLRGRGLLDDGAHSRALTFLRESVRRLPEYTEAQLHLAEALLERDERSDAALEIYRRLAEAGQPEALSMMAKLSDSDAQRWRSRADAAYEELLEEHPSAALTHAAEHFARHGDHARAIQLWAANAELQPNPWSLARLAEAQFAAGRVDAAARTADRALAGEYAPWSVKELRRRLADADR